MTTASELDEATRRAMTRQATIALLQASRAAGARRPARASSSSVYGVDTEERVVESLPREAPAAGWRTRDHHMRNGGGP